MWAFSIDTGKFRRSPSFVFNQPVSAGFAGDHTLVMRLEPTGSDKKTPQLAAEFGEGSSGKWTATKK